MRQFRWAAVGCVAAGGLLAVWCVKEVAAQGPVPLPLPSSEVRPADPFAIPSVPDVKPVMLPVLVVPSPPPTTPVRYVNKPDVEFDYEIDKRGKNRVKAVNLYVRDTIPRLRGEAREGPSEWPTDEWAALVTVEVKDDTKPKLHYTIPAERRHEFRLGITSGNGNVSKPKNDDPPDLVVVLDTTPPTINRFEAEPQRVNTSQMLLYCEYDDEHIGPDSLVVFEYRTSTTGKWTPIRTKADQQLPPVASNRKGVRDMHARRAEWPIPDDAPAEVALRVSVTDLAGNVATKVIDKLDLDTTIPEGKLTGVRAVEPKPAPLPPVSPIGGEPTLPKK